MERHRSLSHSFMQRSIFYSKKKKKEKERNIWREFSRTINFIDEFLMYRKKKLQSCKYFQINAGQNSKKESRNFSTDDLETATTWKTKYVPRFCIRQHKKVVTTRWWIISSRALFSSSSCLRVFDLQAPSAMNALWEGAGRRSRLFRLYQLSVIQRSQK